MNTNTPTTGSKPESHRQKITRFEDAIRKKFKCSAEHKREALSDVRHYPDKSLSIFEFSTSPKGYPGAKECFVWDAQQFKPDDEGVVVVADVQATCDPNELPRMAVWGWLTDSLAKLPDIYVVSRKWTKIDLHENQVMFTYPNGESKLGNFFVREYEGNISVRIRQETDIEFNDWPDLSHVSFSLNLEQIERIEEPAPNTSWFTLNL